MANGVQPNNNTSLFSICYKEAPSANGKFVAFGRVVVGVHLLDVLAKLPVDASHRFIASVVIEDCGMVALQ